MSLPMITGAWLADCESVAAKCVLVALADHHNGKSNRCDPSIPGLAQRCNLSARAVQLAIHKLESLGHITVTRHAWRRSDFELHPRTPEPRSPLNKVHPSPELRSRPPERRSPLPLNQVHPNRNLTGMKSETNRGSVGKPALKKKTRTVEIIP